MRKILLTVMMVSSLLAFNACTKDGAQGPAGPKGDAGAPGAAGAKGEVGPAGAKGADGATIRTGDAAPAASLGNDGDFYFDKTAKVLYGPKAAGAWPATGTSLTGPAGKDGSSVLFGAGVPTEADGKVGDFYFSTDKSTFYGPKAEDGSWAAGNQLPLGTGGAKVYYYNVGFSDVKEVANTKVFGQDIVATYPDYRIFSTYKVNADDIIRIAQYPGWGDNRVMAFETAQGNNDFTNIPANAAALATIPLGTRFVFAADDSKVPAIFNLSQADKDRLTQNPANFDYLLNAKAEASTIALGKDLNFANVKNVGLTASTTKYTVDYTAKVAFDLDKIIPTLEKNIQDDGLVSIRVQEYDVLTGKLIGGWNYNVWNYVDQYTVGGVEYGLGFKTTENLGTPWDVFGLETINNLQFGGTTAAVGTQLVTADPAKTKIKLGSFSYEYTIKSGDVGTGVENINPASGTSYYSTIGNHLTATPATILDLATGDLTLKTNKNGKPADFFTSKPLLVISATVLDAATVKAAQKAGINLEDADALERFVSKR